MKKIAIITATRAEYGLLKPIIQELGKYESSDFKVELVVTGTHLYASYGNTINEIYRDGIKIDQIVDIPVDSENAGSITANQAQILLKFNELFKKNNYDAILILGDRYEMLAIAISAANLRIPIFHICGGDTTEGAMDEWIRHSITKMSYLHFPTNVDSYNRVVQLGEDPCRVYNCGSTSIDNIINLVKMSKSEALASVGLKDCRYAVCTYHPVTMDKTDLNKLLADFFDAIKSFPDMEFIITKSNADNGGMFINKLLDDNSLIIPNIHVFASLGATRYLSLVKHSEFVLGNSSSGIIEAPALKVPTVNIGDRQRGRLQSKSIINCKSDSESIVAAIEKAMSTEHKNLCKRVISPYGDGHAAEKIADKIYDTLMSVPIDLKKKFYTIPVTFGD